MGVVYHAEQTDPVRRRVALKIIKLGMDSAYIKYVAAYSGQKNWSLLTGQPSKNKNSLSS